jgi:glycosyltransferase involved in cell wall biosynthesis
MRHTAYFWFLLWLRFCRLLGIRLVWTAHNVLPHRPVFANDVSARRALVAASDLVLAHSQSALAELAELGAIARRSAVVEHGPIIPLSSDTPALRIPGAGNSPRRFLFFGHVHEYKGVDDLLAAFLTIPEDIPARLTVAGQCDDPELRIRLHALARRCGARIELRLQHVPDEKVAQLLGAADVVVLPFRHVTTSGSAILALSCGRPLIVPDLPGLAHLPDQAVLRYNGGIPALADALVHLACANDETLAVMSAAASCHAASVAWPEIAHTTITEMLLTLGGIPEDGTCPRRLGALMSRVDSRS